MQQLDEQVSQQRRLLEQQQQQLKQQQLVLEKLQSEIEVQRTAGTVSSPPHTQNIAAARGKPIFSSAPGVSVALHGLIDVTGFSQSQPFSSGNGQQAEWPVPGSQSDRRLSGVQLNNTKFWLDISGATLPDGWNVGAHLEADFFGGYNGTTALSYEQPLLRLRLAYAKLDHPDTGTSVIIGQYWTLFSSVANANSPLTMSHLAFPLGSSIGNMGWRYPGVVVFQQLGHPSATSVKWHLDAGVYTGSWNGPGSNTALESAGNIGFRPRVMARLRAAKGDWSLYLAGLYSSADLRGISGNKPTAPVGASSTISTHAVQVGGLWNPGRFRLTGALYQGRGGMGATTAALSQFGDIRDHGGWLQAGYKLTKQLEASLMYSTSRPNKDDVVRWRGYGATGLFDGQQVTAGLFWNQGPFGLGVEYMRARVDQATSLTVPVTTTSGNWFGVSAMYHF